MAYLLKLRGKQGYTFACVDVEPTEKPLFPYLADCVGVRQQDILYIKHYDSLKKCAKAAKELNSYVSAA